MRLMTVRYGAQSGQSLCCLCCCCSSLQATTTDV